jgi:hypothetical protein
MPPCHSFIVFFLIEDLHLCISILMVIGLVFVFLSGLHIPWPPSPLCFERYYKFRSIHSSTISESPRVIFWINSQMNHTSDKFPFLAFPCVLKCRLKLPISPNIWYINYSETIGLLSILYLYKIIIHDNKLFLNTFV